MLLVSPKLAVRDSICKLSKNFRPLANPPFKLKHTMPPPFFICLMAIAYCGCIGKNGYFIHSIAGCSCKAFAINRALFAWRSIRTSNVSKLLLNIHALKGDKDGPVL